MPNNNATNNLFLNQKVTQTAANYTALANDVIIEVTNTSAARTITLPAPSVNNAGKFYVVKDTSGGAATNNISIFPASGLIDGSANLVIATDYGAIQVYSDGSSYYSQAFVIPNPTGIPLARASWIGFSTPFVPGASSLFLGNWYTLGGINSRLDVTGLVELFTPVNITVTARDITIIRPGLYYITLNGGISGAQGNGNVQVVKNGAIAQGTTATIFNANAMVAIGVTYLDYCVAGDVFDIRIGNNGASGRVSNISYSINQLPTTF